MHYLIKISFCNTNKIQVYSNKYLPCTQLIIINYLIPINLIICRLLNSIINDCSGQVTTCNRHLNKIVGTVFCNFANTSGYNLIYILKIIIYIYLYESV